MRALLRSLLAVVLLSSAIACTHAAEVLQIHFMDVGQGDAAVLITPHGEVVLFDDGVETACDDVVAYLHRLHIEQIDYHIASHYHADHIGCAGAIFDSIPLTGVAYDRGDLGAVSIEATRQFRSYRRAVAGKRHTAHVGAKLVLDAGFDRPVTITFVATNGAGVHTGNENDLSLVSLVEFDGFRAEFGGDLSGSKGKGYEDVEAKVAPVVGEIDVYKVHHHCSKYSTSEKWLDVTRPAVAVISVGAMNNYHHPAPECIRRLERDHTRSVYSTADIAGGTWTADVRAMPGTVVLEVEGGTGGYRILTYGGHRTQYFDVRASPMVTSYRAGSRP
jgi:beta-lactamase superfamily II metal-dependent hydrolase